jgi:hypothetical protein
VLRSDKIRLLGFTTLHDLRHATQFRDAWAPHTQTQRHGVLAMVIRPYLIYLVPYLISIDLVRVLSVRVCLRVRCLSVCVIADQVQAGIQAPFAFCERLLAGAAHFRAPDVVEQAGADRAAVAV